MPVSRLVQEGIKSQSDFILVFSLDWRRNNASDGGEMSVVSNTFAQ